MSSESNVKLDRFIYFCKNSCGSLWSGRLIAFLKLFDKMVIVGCYDLDPDSIRKVFALPDLCLYNKTTEGCQFSEYILGVTDVDQEGNLGEISAQQHFFVVLEFADEILKFNNIVLDDASNELKSADYFIELIDSRIKMIK
jgi:hypothetical protein